MCNHLRFRGGIPLLVSLCLLCPARLALGQQDDIPRFDAYGGYTFLDSPSIGLFENGFNAQFGVAVKPWLSAGADYSISSGDLNLTPGLLTTPLRQQVTGVLDQLAAAGQLPPGYMLVVPTHSRTQTFAAGAQLEFRHFTHETLFLRPVTAGAIYETATPHPRDPIAAAISAQLAPSGNVTSYTWFIGAGGGIDFIFSRNFALRTQVDVVWNHLFDDLLQDGRWTVRFSVGPAIRFGRNVKR